MRRMITVLAMVAICLCGSAQTRDIHIVSVNDMHVPLKNMPMLAAIVDSLRIIDSQTLMFSAGDNRTGDPTQALVESSMMSTFGFFSSARAIHRRCF